MRWRNIAPVRIGANAAPPRMNGNDWPAILQTMVSRARINNMQRCIKDLIRDDVRDDLIETGVWRVPRRVTDLHARSLEGRGHRRRTVWVCDLFDGLPPPDPRYLADAGAIWHRWRPLSVSPNDVKANFARYSLLDDSVRFVKGWFKEALPMLSNERWALIRLGGDMCQSTMDGLTHICILIYFPRIKSLVASIGRPRPTVSPRVAVLLFASLLVLGT